jgi:hypothetical protein
MSAGLISSLNSFSRPTIILEEAASMCQSANWCPKRRRFQCPNHNSSMSLITRMKTQSAKKETLMHYYYESTICKQWSKSQFDMNIDNITSTCCSGRY